MDWIAAYLDYTATQVSPQAFHRWSAIAVLGGVLERKIWFECLPNREGRGRFRVFPGQLMVVLVGKSAIIKKTTAGRIATNFLRHLEPWQIYVLPEKFSPQQLLKSLERLDEDKTPMRDPEGRRVNSAAFCFAEELGGLFTTEAFQETLAVQINKLNDCPPGKKTMEFRSWKSELWQACFTMLGCTTPTGVAKELPKAARSAGFFGRILWVHADSTDRRASLMAETHEADPKLESKLIVDLQAIARMRGRVIPSAEAARWYNAWYYDVYDPWLRKIDLPETEQTGYWGRKDAHVLRVGMVLMAAESRTLVLRQRHLEQALHHLEAIERNFPRVLAEVGTTPYQEYEQRFMEVLERHTMAKVNGSRRDLWMGDERLRRILLKFGGGRRHLEAIESLRRAGEIEVRKHGGDLEIRRRLGSGRLLRGTEEETSVRVEE